MCSISTPKKKNAAGSKSGLCCTENILLNSSFRTFTMKQNSTVKQIKTHFSSVYVSATQWFCGWQQQWLTKSKFKTEASQAHENIRDYHASKYCIRNSEYFITHFCEIQWHLIKNDLCSKHLHFVPYQLYSNDSCTRRVNTKRFTVFFSFFNKGGVERYNVALQWLYTQLNRLQKGR